jgi:hypothetical protein
MIMNKRFVDKLNKMECLRQLHFIYSSSVFGNGEGNNSMTNFNIIHKFKETKISALILKVNKCFQLH